MELPMRVRYSLLAVAHARYKKAGKPKKGKILDELIANTGYNRKYAAWLLSRWGMKVRTIVDGEPVVFEVGKRKIKPRTGRPRIYDHLFAAVLIRLWYQFDCLCGKRFVAFLRPLVDLLRGLGELDVDEAMRGKLLSVSPATVDRLLKAERKKNQVKGSSLTRPGSFLKRQIPIRTFSDWNDVAPGFVEADLVGHDGGSAYGSFLCTLTMTDVCSGWTEVVGVLNKAQRHVFLGLQRARERFPVPLLGIDTDNGSEFLNNHLVRYCDQERITFTRSRPYRKNDSCFVEEKNNSIVRRSVGYARFESQESLESLNALYDCLRLLVNFFFPSAKLLEKTRDGSKLHRTYDSPVTPYHRLLASEKVPVQAREALMATYRTLNPAGLARELHDRQDTLAMLAETRTIPFRAYPPRSLHIRPGLSPRSPSSRI
jgi:hypothetical protein